MKRHVLNAFLYGFFILASPAHAETPVFGAIYGNTVWTEAESPYVVLGSFFIEEGAVLNIEPGVVVKNGDFTVRGVLNVNGSSEKPVYFTSLKDDAVGGDTNNDGSDTLPHAGDWPQIRVDPQGVANFNNSVIRYGGNVTYGWSGANFYNKGTLNLVNSTISDSLIFGILSEGGNTVIDHSLFTNNYYGLFFGSGSAQISQSSFLANRGFAVYNSTFHTGFSQVLIDARNNWWGDDDGPRRDPDRLLFTGDLISAGVDFEPFLGSDPLAEPTLPECCSSVLFLPGLEASRLYGEDGKRLWEPEIDHDNTRLFLNSDGSSIEPNIYTEDIIDEAFGSNIYKSFGTEMNGLISAGIINEWEAYPYDWRFDINDIVNNPTRLNSSLTSLIPTLEALAQNSQTGKVTIIAHSNGGLIGKLLISKLESEGKADLVDKFIMVAVPQLGTPKAVSALLHGENLPTDFAPFMMKASTARALAENMASGYTLLPSPEYFNRVLDPVVEFDFTSPLAQIYRDNYGVAITSSTEFHNFLLGAEGRVKPSVSDVISPNIVNETLLDQGKENHIALDNWSAPENIKVIQIAGWGIDTIRGIKYTERRKHNCLLNCLFLDPEPIMTSDGDSTVVVPSAKAMNVQSYHVNLRAYNKLGQFQINRKHASILEIDDVRMGLIAVIKDSQVPESSFFATEKPIIKSGDKSIRLRVHSPVSLDIYDEFGNHTGITSAFGEDKLIEENIPNSYYLEMGEGKYAGADILGTTTIKLIGQDFGTFTLEIEKVVGDEILATSTFQDIPVALGSIANINYSEESAFPILVLDINADGISDSTITPGAGLTTEELIGVLIGFIKTLHLPEDRETTLLRKVDKLARTLSADYYRKQRTDAAFANLIRAIDGYVKKGLLTSTEATELKSVIVQISGEVVE